MTRQEDNISQTIIGLEGPPTIAPGSIEILEPEIESRVRTHPAPASDWLCAWCLNHVASEDDRFSFDGASQFSFKNPDGILFHIITFSQTIGCQQTGVPNLAHTWFAGHAWSYCVCARCRTHLGWYYSGQNQFAGLICDRIVRASLVRN